MKAKPKVAKPVTTSYLVIDTVGEARVHVFMDCNPAPSGGPFAEAVTLELLPGGRYSSSVVLGARPVLGRDPANALRYREFRSDAEIERANFLPISSYRICHSWDDYFDPWGARPAMDQTTDLGRHLDESDPVMPKCEPSQT